MEDSVAVLVERIDGLKETIEQLRTELREMKNDFVTKAEFEPVKKLAYGMVAIVLVAVFGAVLALVLR